MHLQELKDEVARVGVATKREVLERLVLYVSTGDAVYPQYEKYLAEACGYRAFFDAIYADDGQKSTSVWAEWAKFAHKKWVDRFEPVLQMDGIRLKADGLPIAFGTGIVLAPTGSRDNIAGFRLFPSGGFNTEAATFVTSLGGSFTCAGYDFTGIYGLYHSQGTVILEEWEAQAAPAPTKEAFKRMS